MTSLSLVGIQKQLGKLQILRGIDLEVESGEFIVLVGPSGCGKSTLLRTVAGLEIPDAGRIHIGGRDVTHLPPRERHIGMVFQSYALYPHLTVRENLAFALMLRKADPAAIEARVREVASMLGLEALLDRYPRELSGGQRQRVAMGRAIAKRPSLFLFDEPLSNLDAALRAEVRVEIKRLHTRLEATMLYVTHDQVEAMTLADRLVVLRAGKIEQVGRPLEVYAHPSNRFVASFLGSPSMNFLKVKRQGERLVAPGLSIEMPEGIETPKEFLLGVRPHDVERVDKNAHLRMEIDVIEAMGFESYAYGEVGEDPSRVAGPFVARLGCEDAQRLRRGDRIGLFAKRIHLFDLGDERSLGCIEFHPRSIQPVAYSRPLASLSEAGAMEKPL
ncbi:MAG: sn-glycerol-3-phosphate ABC transporter ATP-binding protein UgpC [Sandaracinaceae bacterium]|nr:sn-glycerol-3-phosphate ABC transporter ATP-binding protein UgpC [Sandaracinaceae bacterium]